MKLIKKNNEQVYEVQDSSWFEQHTHVISEPDDNGTVFDFLQENVKGTDTEDDYKAWLREHVEDYYFAVAIDNEGDYYAVAYESANRAAYACEIENLNEEETLGQFLDLEHLVSYNDTTAFVYNDGTQTMCTTNEITEDSLHSFAETDGPIYICNMGDLPDIKKLMRDEILEVFRPADNVQDDNYEQMKENFNKNNGRIAYCEYEGTTTYMLVW